MNHRPAVAALAQADGQAQPLRGITGEVGRGAAAQQRVGERDVGTGGDFAPQPFVRGGTSNTTMSEAWSASTASLEPAQVDGDPALIPRLDGEVDTVIALRIDDA